MHVSLSKAFPVVHIHHTQHPRRRRHDDGVHHNLFVRVTLFHIVFVGDQSAVFFNPSA